MKRWLLGIFALLFWTTATVAHEVRPTIGDLTTNDGAARLSLQLNVEAFVAGIDLDDLEDTDAAPQAQDYDTLRALSPEDLQARFAPVAEQMASEIAVIAGDGPLSLSVSGIEIGETGDVEGLRDSTVTFTAHMPASETVELVWPEGYGTIILRQIDVPDGFTGYLNGGQSSGEIAVTGGDAAGWASVSFDYIFVGFDHIIPQGLDHILFVLGLFFLSLRLGTLLWQISAFTLAHTVTLALGALGIVVIPGSIVEPIIAASIVYVAVENILSPQMTRWRPFVVFAFGLLHGLGFASVLGEFGLPAGQFVPALIGFNIGVEVGQLAVVAMAYAAVGFWFGQKPWYRKFIAIPASVFIAAVGTWWVIERVFL